MDREELIPLWAYMGEMWTNHRPPGNEVELAARQQVWMDMLGEFDLAEVRVALVRLSDSDFAPPVGAIRKECAQVRAVVTDEVAIPDVDEAWGEVKRKIHTVGYHTLPEFSHPLTAQVVGSLGWQEICFSTDPEGVLRGQFAHLFRVAAERFSKQLAGPTAPELALGIKPEELSREEVPGIGTIIHALPEPPQ